MAARRTRRKTTRRRTQKRGFNIVNALELYVQTDVITRNVMGTNPFTALTGMEKYTSGGGKGFGAAPVSTQIGYYPQGSSVTLPELLGLDKMTSAGTVNRAVDFGQGIDVMKANFQANLFPMLIQSIGVRAGFAIGKKLMSKQRSFINNKVLKPIGLKSVVSV